MKRLHLHVSVSDLDEAVRYYSAVFGAEPTRLEGDYAKWRLDDPAVNFAISTFEAEKGLNHLGVEVESQEELDGLRARIGALGQATADEADAECCYAVSDKTWSRDPAGIAWEAFLTSGRIAHRGTDRPPMVAPNAGEAAARGAGEAAPASPACCA